MNYSDTMIEVADDCRVEQRDVPPLAGLHGGRDVMATLDDSQDL